MRKVRWLYFIILILTPILANLDDLIEGIFTLPGDGMITMSSKIFEARYLFTDFPLWNRFVGMGTPFIGSPDHASLYPFNLLLSILDPVSFSNVYFIIHLVTMGIFSFYFIEQVTNNQNAAFYGAFVLENTSRISGFRREHILVYTAIVWLPLILFFIMRYSKTKKIKYLLASALAMTIQLSGGHPQLVFYSIAFAFLFLIILEIKNKSYTRDIVISLSTLLIAFLLFSSVLLIPAFKIMVQANRSSAANYFCLFSTSWENLSSLLFPYLYSLHPISPLGDYKTSGADYELYYGIIPLAFAGYVLTAQNKNNLTRLGLAVLVLVFFYSSICNIPILGDLAQSVPIINSFGVQSRVLFIFDLFFCLLAGLGFAALFEKKNVQKIRFYSFCFLLAVFSLSLTASATGSTPMNTVDPEYYSIRGKVFEAPILLAFTFLLLMSFLATFNDSLPRYTIMLSSVAIILVGITFIDVNRFSGKHLVSDFDQLSDTEVTLALKTLPDISEYRLLPIYEGYYDPEHVKTGLVDNWNMMHSIMNLKGFSEFDNLDLNLLLDQIESRDPTRLAYLLFREDLLSMLSVKYILFPNEMIDATGPADDFIEIASLDRLAINGDGELNVQTIDLPQKFVKENTVYTIEVTISSNGSSPDLFYFDIYGGNDYLSPLRTKMIPLVQGMNSYRFSLMTDSKYVPEKLSLRVVSQTKNFIEIRNLRVMERNIRNSYEPILSLESQTLYRNDSAMSLIYIPDRIKPIDNVDVLLNFPESYPDMDAISYVADYPVEKSVDGSLTSIKITNNRVSGIVTSASGTFLNHTQAFDSDWRVYVDGLQQKIWRVNGVIQGVDVPPGRHEIVFVYQPIGFYAGVVITMMSLFGFLLLVIKLPDLQMR